MAATPRAYLWKEAQLINGTAEGTGATFHFYDTQAQAIYLHNGLEYKAGVVPEGHWEDLTWGSEKELEDVNYAFLKSDHPATGSLYMVALHHNTQKDNDILYLFRYDYIRDVSELVEECTLSYQVDNPIAQIAAKIKNVKDALFTSEASLFAPSSKLTLGVAYGKGSITTMAIGYTDEVNWKYGSKTVSISGRNSVGFYLNDQSYDADEEYNGNGVDVFTTLLEKFGITKFVIDPLLSSKTIKLSVNAKDTALKTIQTMCAICTTTTEEGKMCDIEEAYDGTVVIGFDAFRGEYLPRGTYKFDGKNDVFMQSINRAIDGVYTKVRCVGTDNNKKDLDPEIANVESWKYWRTGPYKIYHAQKVEGTTQGDLRKYAEALATQLKWVGRVIKYKTPLRPQLIIGDIAEMTHGIDVGEETPYLGTITEIKHTFGQKGYFTEFTLDSGGNVQKLENGRVYTTGKALGGANRGKKITDFIAASAEKTTSGGTPAAPQPHFINYAYAKFTGEGHIVLPFNVSRNYRIYVKFDLNGDYSNRAIFGNGTGSLYQHLGVSNGMYSTSTGSNATTFSASMNGQHSFVSNMNNSNRFDNNQATQYTPTSPGATLWLAGSNGMSDYTGKLYNFQIIDIDTTNLVLDLTPRRYVAADGETLGYGLYDSVSGQFYHCTGMELYS